MIPPRFARRPLPLLAAAFLLAAFLPAAGLVLADGGFFRPPYYEIWESSQTAFIQHRDGIEDLRILPGFHGDAREFAWIVPVPALPTVGSADTELFVQAATMTQPLYRNRDSEWGCEQEGYDTIVRAPGGVEILAEQLVGMYRTMIIGADNAAALVDSLVDWEFLHSENISTVMPILESYVDRGWFFVTMKVDEAVLEEELPDLPYYWYGQMQPIRLTFPSDEMVYPLRISSLSAATTSQVLIFTVSDHRLTFPGAETWYANRISASEWTAINRRYPALGAELETGDFLTKLRRDYSPAQMTGDLVLARAGSDDEFRPVNYSGFPLFNLLLAGSLLGWPVLRLGLRWRKRRPRSE